MTGFVKIVLPVLALTLAAPALAQVRDWPNERPPRPTSAKDVQFPPYQVRTLKNGLQVIAVSHHEQPAVTLRLIVRAGGSQDPIEKPGVAAFMAGLLDQGTTTRSAEQIANTIDSIGGVLGSGSMSDLTSITAAVMKDSFDLALDLVSDVARNPAFAADEIERQRKQILSGLQVSYEDPEYLAGIVFDRLVYGFHPYGKPDAGTPASIASITRDDLVKFHKAWFGANNAILAIVGDVKAEEAFAGAERAFGNWARAEQTVIKPVDPPPPTRRVVIIDRPGAVQTEIRAGNIGLPRESPDYMALNLALRILGGEGGNRLHRVLRSERGLTYGASAELHAFKDAGHIIADTDTRSETTAETLRLLVDEMARLRRERVHPRELSEAQAYITGSFPLTIETPGNIAMQVINAVFFGRDLKEIENYRERVNAVTVDDVQRVSQKYLHPDRLSIVLVGDATKFSRELPALGFDQVERISLDQLDLTSPDLRRKRAAAPLPASEHVRGYRTAGLHYVGLGRQAPASDAKQLVTRAIQAKGGADKLRSIRTVTANVRYSAGPLGVMSFPGTFSIQYPDRFRVDTMMRSGRIIQVYAAGEYWIRDQRGARQAPPEMVDEIESRVQRDAVLLLLRLASGDATATRVADVVEGGRALPALLVKGANLKPVTLVLDPDTALILRQRYLLRARQMEEEYSDYRDVDGLKVAFKAVIRGAGMPTLERVVQSFRYNVPVDPALFIRQS